MDNASPPAEECGIQAVGVNKARNGQARMRGKRPFRHDTWESCGCDPMERAGLDIPLCIVHTSTCKA